MFEYVAWPLVRRSHSFDKAEPARHHVGMIWIQRFLLIALALYLLLVLLAYIFQRSLLYFPPDFYNPPPDWMVEIEAADGSMAWWAAPARETAPVILVFHGNASAIDSNMLIFRDLHAQGYGVMSIGYPGYPGNAGKPTQSALTSAAISQRDWVLAQGVSADRIVLYGTSLGSGVAAQVAADQQPGLIILDAPFQSTLAIAKQTMRFLPVGILMKDRYRSDRALAELDMPLIWIHGRKDRVIPLASGQALYDGYSGPKTAHILENGEHHNGWLMGGREIVLTTLAKLEAD